MAATPVKTYVKDPDALLDYTMDFREWLQEDTLLTATWTVPSGLFNLGEFRSSATATIFLYGGVPGTSYLISVRVTTAGGRIEDRTFQINAVDR